MPSPSASARTRLFVSSSGRLAILMASPLLYHHNSTLGSAFCHGTAAEIAELYVVSLEHAVGTNSEETFTPRRLFGDPLVGAPAVFYLLQSAISQPSEDPAKASRSYFCSRLMNDV